MSSNTEFLKSIINLDNPNRYQEQDRRFAILQQNTVSVKVKKYVDISVRNVEIEIGTEKRTEAIVLAQKGLLEGWCWQTTEFLSPFFNEKSFICRGDLHFSPNEKYYHAWLEFALNNNYYVFDPCLNILCPKEQYDSIFEVEVMSKIPSEKVKKELIEYILSCDEKGVYISGTNNIDDVFYRTNSRVNGKAKKDKILTLVPHYYYIG